MVKTEGSIPDPSIETKHLNPDGTRKRRPGKKGNRIFEKTVEPLPKLVPTSQPKRKYIPFDGESVPDWLQREHDKEN